MKLKIKSDTFKTRWNRRYTIIPKGRNGDIRKKYWTKERPEVQTPNIRVPRLIPEGLDVSILVALLPVM